MEQPIMLRLTLENMKWQIVQALYPREVEMKERVEQIVQEAFTSFDFEAEIRQQVMLTVRNEIQQKVGWAIREALNKKKNPYLEQRIEAEVEKQLRKSQ